MKKIKRFCYIQKAPFSLLSLFLLLHLSPEKVFAQKTWTGAVSSEWTNAANWSGGVPTAVDAVIIANATTSPVISASVNAAARSVLVQAGASLVISSQASLTIAGKADYQTPFTLSAALNNLGTITNQGQLTVGSASESAQYGILNQSSLSNTGQGVINIDYTDDTGFFNAAGYFTNEAGIFIGKTAAVGYHGIWNDGTFTNNSAAVVGIDRSSLRAIVNNTNTMLLAGKITIGEIANVGAAAIENRASLSIDVCANVYALKGNFINQSAKTVLNKGALKVAGNIENSGSFTNQGIVNYGALVGSIANQELIVKNSNPIFELGTAVTAVIDGIFKDSDGLISAGVFESPNTFTPDASVASGIHTLYAKILLSSSGCYYLVSFTYQAPVAGAPTQTTWNGTVSSDWTNSANWSNGVPTSNSIAIIGAIVSNRPTLTSGQQAVAYAVQVQQSAVLTLDQGASLTVSGAAPVGSQTATAGYYNQGALYNNGSIILGKAAGSGSYGMYNEFTVENKGTIQIDYSTEAALYNARLASFSNQGPLKIGQIASVGGTGIVNGATFTNSQGSAISIDRFSAVGISNSYVSGQLDGDFLNGGNISIGSLGSSGSYGLYSTSDFRNNPGASISVDGWSVSGIYNDNIFNSSGDITIGESSGTGDYGLHNIGDLLNDDCGKLSVLKGKLLNAGRLTNNSFLYVATSLDNQRQVDNDGLASIGDNSFEVNFFNTGLIIQNQKRPIFIYPSSSFSGTVNGIYKDISGTESAGSFTAPNTFVPATASSEIRTFYASVSINSGECTFLMPFRYAPDAPDMQVKGNNVLIENNDNSPTSLDNTDFGQQIFVAGSAVRTFTITNAGQTMLNLSATPIVTLSGSADFTVTSQPQNSVAALESTTFEITFDPSSLGLKTAQVSISSNDQAKNPYVFTIQGTGQDGCVDAPAAGTITWNGSKDNNWNNICNWTPTTVPAAGNDVLIPAVAIGPILGAGMNAHVKTVEIQSGGSLSIQGSMTVDGDKTIGGSSTAFYNAGTLENTGALYIGNQTSPPTYGLVNKGEFTNSVCAQLYLYAPVQNETVFTNTGWMLVQTQGAHLNSGTFNNTGILSYGFDNQITNVVNDQIIILPSIASSCQPLTNTFALGNSATMSITGIFLDVNAVTSAGSYDQATNTFTPSGLSERNYNAFIRVQDQTNGCTRMVPWKLTATRCCVNPVFSAPTVVQPAYPVATGSITLNVTSLATLEYSVTAGESWSSSPSFDALGVGSYVLEARIKDFETCKSVYENNPVIIHAYTATLDVWTGAVSDDWAVNGNWQDGSTPTLSDDVSIPSVTRAPVVKSATAAVAKSVFIAKDASLTVADQGSLTINGSVLYSALASGASPLNFTAALNNLGSLTNRGSLVLGSNFTLGAYGIVNQGTFLNDTGGSISVDRSEDTGIYQAGGSFVNNASILIGQSQNIGNHGIWNDASFVNNGQIKIDRSTLRALVNNADQTRSIAASFENNKDLIIGAVSAVGKAGIENLSVFENKTNGNIQINSSTENAVYHASGQFNNEGEIGIGQSLTTGVSGLMLWADFANKSGGKILIDRLSGVGIRNNGAVLTNQGEILLGQTAQPGRTGIENTGTLNNTAEGKIRIYSTRDAGMHHISGVLSNQGLVLISIQSSSAGDGLWTESAFTNDTDGEVRIDIQTGNIAFKQTGSLFENLGLVAIGSTLTGAGTGLSISKGAQFDNLTGAQITIDRCNASGIDIADGTLNNYAAMQLGSMANLASYGLQNRGTFTNNIGTDGSRAQLRIDRSSNGAIYAGGTITNNADIIIGSAGNVGKNGIEGVGSLKNNSGGKIQIDGGSIAAVVVGASFINEGVLTLGSVSSVGRYGIYNTGSFQNLSGANLSIARASDAGIYQQIASTNFTNAGTIDLGQQIVLGKVGIQTFSNFSNLSGGVIRIDNSTDVAVLNAAGTFTNEAEITIGGLAGVGTYGFVNRGVFANNSGGSIHIDRSTDTGLYSSAGSFTNQASIIIGKNAGVGVHGIFNEASFINTGAAKIQIGRSTLAGLRNFNGQIKNEAEIIIGESESVSTYGVYNQSAFDNIQGAKLTIDNAVSGLFISANTFSNSGNVIIGKLAAMSALLTGTDGTFVNHVQGVLQGTGLIQSANLVHDNGTLSPGYSPGLMTLSGDRDFAGSVLDIEINGAGVVGIDYDQIEVQGAAVLGGTLKLSVNYTPTNGDVITLLKAGAISGQFEVVTGDSHWRLDYTSGDAVKLVYDSTLPVTLVSFDATPSAQGVLLAWRTSSETNNAGFYIEKSTNAVSWLDIGFVDGKGTVSGLKSYGFLDNHPAQGVSYYRLRQVDYDGSIEYSRIQSVRFQSPDSELIIWVDQSKQAHVKTDDAISQVVVFDTTGRAVAVSAEKVFSLSHVNTGLVLVRVNTDKGIVTKKVIIWP